METLSIDSKFVILVFHLLGWWLEILMGMELLKRLHTKLHAALKTNSTNSSSEVSLKTSCVGVRLRAR